MRHAMTAALLLLAAACARDREASISRAPFGRTPERAAVEGFTLTNAHGVELQVITYGAIIVSLRVPDRTGQLDDVGLGDDSLAGYRRDTPYFGAIVGRDGNRIAQGRVTLGGRTYRLGASAGDSP